MVVLELDKFIELRADAGDLEETVARESHVNDVR